MGIALTTPLLDACVLAILSKEDTYGYVLTQELCNTFALSESTLYPVLRRLKKEKLVETYDQTFQGRIRRYYRITQGGSNFLTDCSSQWVEFRDAINHLFKEAGHESI